MKTAFFAYPANPKIVGETIENALVNIRHRNGAPDIKSWRAMDIPGVFIAEKVLEHIDAADCLIADITVLNFNVTYEVGYAIGKSKRVYLIKNDSVPAQGAQVATVGIFDTIGYKTYINADDLSGHLNSLPDTSPISVISDKKRAQPVYVIDTKYKTDWFTTIVSRLKKAKLNFRSFDPNEQSRLNAHDAILEVQRSYGVLIPLDDRIKDADIHNLRAAFIAGLADGFGVYKMIIQNGDSPVPIDYRDFSSPAHHPKAIQELVAAFAADVADLLQQEIREKHVVPETFLQSIELGASSAENEARYLDSYYLDTDAFRRANRGEVRLVVGRKGSGKSAIFFQVRARNKNIKNVIVDLKPDGYKLRKFKDSVLALLKGGSAEHTIMAFWEYLLLLEIAHKILESDRAMHLRDQGLYKPYQELAEIYRVEEYSSEGDFSERMGALIDRISNDYIAKYGAGDNKALSAPEITELIFKHDLERLGRAIEEYVEHKEEMWLLFDNIDKGWPTHGIDKDDILLIRTLLEATRKLERKFQKKNVETHTVVFLRNDVYELLVEETPDRGKETKVLLDWTDPDMLREVLRRRIVVNDLDETMDFMAAWREICVSHVHGEESSEYLIERSMMRPRFLIDLVNHCKSYAVNLNHDRIDGVDIEKGLAAFSNDLLADISLEIRDVYPDGENAIYAFISCQKRVQHDVAKKLLNDIGVGDEKADEIIKTFLWYGVFGVLMPTGDVKYIYNVHYNSATLFGYIQKLAKDGVVYYINPGFWPALGIE